MPHDPFVYYSTGEGKGRYPKQYSVMKHKGETVIQQAIRIIMPNYNWKSRPRKVGKLLDWEMMENIAWVNGVNELRNGEIIIQEVG